MDVLELVVVEVEVGVTAALVPERMVERVAVGVEEWDAEKVAFELLVTVCMLVQDWETLAVGERETLDDEGVAVGVSERDSDTEGDFDWDTDAV